MNEADQSRPVVGERGLHRRPTVLFDEVAASGLGERCVDRRAAIDLGERADPIPAILPAERPDMRKFQVAPGPDFLDELIAVIGRAHLVEDRLTVGVNRPQPTVI